MGKVLRLIDHTGYVVYEVATALEGPDQQIDLDDELWLRLGAIRIEDEKGIDNPGPSATMTGQGNSALRASQGG